MKILLVHADYIEFITKEKALRQAIDEPRSGRMEECLVAFTAVESGDEGISDISEKLVKEIVAVADQVKTRRIVLYPYAHLSKSLSTPGFALDVLKTAEQLLEKEYEVLRAPFGWYKAFTIKAKGHPLSELSREITSEAAEKPKKIVRKKLTLRDVTKRTHLDREKLSKNDHRILGQELDLYSFQEVAPGMAFLHPNGMLIRNLLLEFWRKEHYKRGYKEINTPLVLNKALWEISGHWDHYKENMYFTEIDNDEFALKPMNCPGAIMVFNSSTRSYRDLPLRLAELGQVHRHELSGVLAGLFRLRYFTQDDTHIFVTPDQLEHEVLNVVELVDYFYKKFQLEYHVELSTRPEKRIGSDGIWDKAETALENALKKKGLPYKINPGDGAFYGPKIDFHIKDSHDRTWQCATVQVDFQMPERFDINYIAEDNKPHRPVIVHRVVYGAVERFMGILTEHYNGAFPVWLSPVQARIISFTDRNEKKAKELVHILQNEGLRVDSDLRPATVDYKVRDAEMQKIPYIIVIGDKEEKAGTIAVRKRGSRPEFGVKLDDFLQRVKSEISEMS